MDMYFRQFWHDPRLNFSGRLDVDKLVLSGEERANYPIWVPDTFFVNSKKAHLHTQTVPNEFARIMKNGDVLVSKRFEHAEKFN